MKHSFFKLLLVLALFCSVPLSANFDRNGLITPSLISASSVDTIFKNPAELTLYDQVFEWRLNYETDESNFGSTFIFHLPDHWGSSDGTGGWGDFALTWEVFGSDFFQNLLFYENDEGDFEFDLAESGNRVGLTWAKKWRLFTAGVNAKFYNYEVKANSSQNRNAVGFDAGLYMTPFEDLYLGLVYHDIGDTLIKDDDGNVQETIEQDLQFSAAVLSGKDMSFSVSIPFRLFRDLKNNPKQAWKTISVQGKKVFDDTFEVALGSNTKDAYALLGFRFNEYSSFRIIGSHSLYEKDSVGLTFGLSFNLPTASLQKKQKVKPKKSPATSVKEAQKDRYKTRYQRLEEERQPVALPAVNRPVEPTQPETAPVDKVERKIEDKINELEIKKIDHKIDLLKSKKAQYKELKEELGELVD